jgi:ATP-dependent RNA helicase HelY
MPRKVETVERLDAEGLLPAIWFIFSRNGCDEAMAACRDAGVRLTSQEDRALIRTIAETHTASLSAADLKVLATTAGWRRWRLVAAHHAGWCPPSGRRSRKPSPWG